MSTSTKVVSGKIRMSYVNLFTPRAIEDGQEPRYSLCILIPKSDELTISKINSAIDAAKNAGTKLWGGRVPQDLMTPLKDGDEEKADQMGFEGHYFLNASSKQKPGVVDRKLNEILDESQVYAGCYGRVSLNFYPFKQGENQGVGCGLQNVQKLSDGEMLTSRTRAEDDFEAVDDEENILG